MGLQISLSDFRLTSWKPLGDFPLHIWYKQITDFGDRLEELGARIEWGPFINLLAAGFWIRQKL
jgi:hypothetical protein